MRLLIVSEGSSELGGALEALVQRLLEIDFQSEQMKISDHELRASHGKGPRLFKKAIRCMLFAQERGFDGVVVVIDQDGDMERRKHFSDAQADQQYSLIPRAFGVAVEMFDAWMLADERVLTLVLGTQIQRQPDPENTRDPKDAFSRLCEGAGFKVGMTETYASIARQLQLGLLEGRCPLGFASFSARVRRMFGATR